MKTDEQDKALDIAILVDRFGRRFGGAEAHSVDLVEQLSTRHNVTVIAHEFDHQLPVTEVKVLGPRWWPSWFRVLHFAFKAKRLTHKGFDIVHSNMDGPAGDIQVVHVSPYRFRRLFKQGRWRRFLRWISLRNAVYFWLEASRLRMQTGRKLVAVAPIIRDQLRAAYGQALDIKVIPPGVNACASQTGDRHSVRAEIGAKPDDILCLLVARNPLRKGLIPLLEAVSNLPEPYKVLVVGAHVGLYAELVQRQSSWAERLFCVQPTAQVSPYYLAADLCVHPSLGDSFGMAPLEAMAHGLAVIVSGPEYCGFSQYAKHGHDAWIISDPSQPEQIGQAILTLMASPDLRHLLIANSAELVAQLSWTNVAKQFEALYEQCLSEKRVKISDDKL